MVVLDHLAAKFFVRPPHVLRYIIPLSSIIVVANKFILCTALTIEFSAPLSSNCIIDMWDAKDSKFLNEYDSSLIIIEIRIGTLDLSEDVRLSF